MNSPAVNLKELCASDRDSAAKHRRKYRHRNEGDFYEEIAGAQHLPMLECPHAFNAILLEWLDAQRGAPH